MRDIAAAAGMSLGSAYYYYPSKEAMLLAHYEQRNHDHAERVHQLLEEHDARQAAGGDDPGGALRARIEIVMREGLELLRRDRKLMAALARSLGDPSHPLSVFGNKTGPIRQRSLAIFAGALAGAGLPDDLRELMARALWLTYLGLILYYIRDDSRGQERTFALMAGGLDLLVPLVQLAASPALAPLRAQLEALLGAAGLLEPF
jgi:AcrR family transcriptional regulator